MEFIGTTASTNVTKQVKEGKRGRANEGGYRKHVEPLAEVRHTGVHERIRTPKAPRSHMLGNKSMGQKTRPANNDSQKHGPDDLALSPSPPARDIVSSIAYGRSEPLNTVRESDCDLDRSPEQPASPAQRGTAARIAVRRRICQLYR